MHPAGCQATGRVFRMYPGLKTDALLAVLDHERFGRIAVFSLLALWLILPPWLRGGSHASWTAWIPWVSVLGLALLAVHTRRRQRNQPHECAHPVPAGFWRDPVFYAGLPLLILLVCQWLNAGRAWEFVTGEHRWVMGDPPVPSLPGAIQRAEARQMLDWFLPAWGVALLIRSGWVRRREVRLIWRTMVYNAGLLVLLGIVQYLADTSRMYGVIPMATHFFATFGYPNHAGSYFLLAMTLGAGLLAWELQPHGVAPRRARRIVLLATILLCWVGTILSLSRWSILISGLLLVALVGILIFRYWPHLNAVQRLNTVVAGTLGLVLAVLFAVGAARTDIEFEFKPRKESEGFLTHEVNLRSFQLGAAARMWWDNPWFGVGGWGYRHLLGAYVPREQWSRISEGKANVHNDPLQFLTELGLVGAGSLALMIAILIKPLSGPFRRRSLLILFPLSGVALVALQSLFDLPFRSAAMLPFWFLVLAGAARVEPPSEPNPEGSNQLKSSPAAAKFTPAGQRE